MDRRFALFAVLVALIFVVNQVVFSVLFPPEPAPKPGAAKQVAEKKAPPPANEPAVREAPQEEKAPPPDDAKKDEPQKEAPAPPAEPSQIPPQRGTLGSLDRASSYRMVVTWNNQGAAIERIELNGPDYRSLDDRSGYLGYLAPLDAPRRAGALVRVVAPGTPAAIAGIERDDVITAFDGQAIRTAGELMAALEHTKPGQTISISLNRAGAAKRLSATPAHQPLDLVRAELDTRGVQIVKPGDHDPLSFLTTVHQFDDRSLPADDKQVELGGVHLHTMPWEVVKATEDQVAFKALVPKLELEFTKIYKLARVPQDQRDNAAYPAYSLMLEVRIANVGASPHKVGYRQDGPNGLPIEGAWYASKVSRTWGSAGLRDVLAQFKGGRLVQVSPAVIVDPEDRPTWGDTASLDYAAVDAQYFAAAMIPQKRELDEIWHQSIQPIRAGAIPKESADLRLLNVSFRLDSKLYELAPGGPPLEHKYQIFAGPKRPALLAQYGQPGASLSDLVYYGWFGVVARPMLAVLHFFYTLVANYGLAIIMLTVVVRGCMFPLSRKQALGAQKMQELQPEMRRIAEKFKNDPEKRTRATQDLFRQHNYNPLGGCLLVFVQTPIFIGLYRSLMVDVELRQAPLITESIRWASNLAAPDMLWNWSGIMPAFITGATGILSLGPYFNILPIVTIALFLWQQKMFMPPPADEQARMQQKMMQYMMIFMGVLFFKVASGLCVYFIASSLWGLAERKFLPKAAPKTGAAPAAAAPAKTATPAGNGAPEARKRQRK